MRRMPIIWPKYIRKEKNCGTLAAYVGVLEWIRMFTVCIFITYLLIFISQFQLQGQEKITGGPDKAKNDNSKKDALPENKTAPSKKAPEKATPNKSETTTTWQKQCKNVIDSLYGYKQGWKFMSCSHVKCCVNKQAGSWMAVHKSEQPIRSRRSGSWPNSWPWLKLLSFRFRARARCCPLPSQRWCF